MAITTEDVSKELNLTMLVLGLFTDIVNRIVRDTMLDFARDTGAFQSAAEVDLDAGESEAMVLMDTANTEDALIVLQMSRDNHIIKKCDHVSRGVIGIPTCFRDVTMNKVAFNTIAPEDLYYQAVCLAVPKITANNFRHEFLQYKETLQHGASAKICLTRGGDWFNPEMAQYHAQEYQRLKRLAKAEAMQRLNQTIQPARFV